MLKIDVRHLPSLNYKIHYEPGFKTEIVIQSNLHKISACRL